MIFQLTVKEWEHLHKLSAEARTTPVILVGGVNAAAVAHDRVMSYWGELGRKHGFIPSTVRPHNESRREITARPVTSWATT